MPPNRSFLSFFRILLPAWNFFDIAGDRPELFYRTDFHDWQPAFVPRKAHLGNLFLNSPGNLFHAGRNLVGNLLLDINEVDPEKIEHTLAYRLVENFVRSRVLESSPQALGTSFQFKIQVRNPEAADALISRTHEV